MNSKAKFRGARASNAGDYYHELWALHRALALLDPASGMKALVLEGMHDEDEEGKELDTIDGIDCTAYFGGDRVETAKRIELIQIKHSAADPTARWTVSRLTQNKGKRAGTSVISRLAKLFGELENKAQQLIQDKEFSIQLVSNQPIDSQVREALKAAYPASEDGKRAIQNSVKEATALNDESFKVFLQLLNFDGCGSDSRTKFEQRILKVISDLVDSNAPQDVTNLLRMIRASMLPEGDKTVTRERILLEFGVSYPEALFPCPSEIKNVQNLVPRRISKDVANLLANGEQRVCIHGEGGCGKTTALQEISSFLPENSVFVVFDCYGRGTYLDPDAFRHKPKDAFLQLSNELAVRTGSPQLLKSWGQEDHVKNFRRRLNAASDLLLTKDSKALLVVAIDAADNSITAASTRTPPEISFVTDFVSIGLQGGLPANVRFLVTARSGRLPLLNLPGAFTTLPIGSFESSETATYVKLFWADAPQTWIDDFHHYSRGIPRVQHYAFNFARTEPRQALDWLLPNGKNLTQIFEEQLKFAMIQAGKASLVNSLCAGLIALPRPIPLAALAAVTDLTVALIKDICADLGSAIYISDDSISFADEDFEHFIQESAKSQMADMQVKCATYLSANQDKDAYAATHLASALFLSGRGKEVIHLARAGAPQIIKDPVLRREAHLERLRIAMRVCRETENRVDALSVLIIGAEAKKTDTAIQKMIGDNPDLAALLATETAGKLVLKNETKISDHGALLLNLMLAHAEKCDAVGVREEERFFRAWLKKRDAHRREQEKKFGPHHIDSWRIDYADIAARTEAVLRISGPYDAAKDLQSWTPRNIAAEVAPIVCRKLILTGEVELVENCLAEKEIDAPWEHFAMVPLAIAGHEIDVERLRRSILTLKKRRQIKPERIVDAWQREDKEWFYLDNILSACEILIFHKNEREIIDVVRLFLNPLLRRRDKLFLSQSQNMDLSLRAYTLIQNLDGKDATLDGYWIELDKPVGFSSEKERQQFEEGDRKKKEELTRHVGPLLELYQARAKLLARRVPISDAFLTIKKAVDSFRASDYRFSNEFGAPEATLRAALGIIGLLAIPSIEPKRIWDSISILTTDSSMPFGLRITDIYEKLALRQELRQLSTEAIVSLAEKYRTAKDSASGKISALTHFSRAVLPLHRTHASDLFTKAVEVADEVDSEAFHEIELVNSLVSNSESKLSDESRRLIGAQLATYFSHAGINLSDMEHFPWHTVAESLAKLDIGIALAATARWEDAGIVSRSSMLPPVLKSGLGDSRLSCEQVLALTAFLNRLRPDLLDLLAARVRERPEGEKTALADLMAQNELLRFGKGHHTDSNEKILSLSSDATKKWTIELKEIHEFLKRNTASSNGLDKKLEKEVKNDPFEGIPCPVRPIESADVLLEVVREIAVAARKVDRIVSHDDVLKWLRPQIKAHGQVQYLESLAAGVDLEMSDYYIAHEIVEALKEWQGNSAVDAWRREKLNCVVADFFPGFAAWLPSRECLLFQVLPMLRLSNIQTVEILFAAIESNVESFRAETIYALIGFISSYMERKDVADVLTTYATNLAAKVPLQDREIWKLEEIPTEAPRAVSRYIFSMLGDLDVRTRWRAAHALRVLAKLGEPTTLASIISLWDKKTEEAFRRPDAPFYWLASRLWLVIAMDRIALESPGAIKQFSTFLISIAMAEEFPHVLIRSFAKLTIEKLLAQYPKLISKIQRKAIASLNKTSLPRAKALKDRQAQFDKYRYTHSENRKFKFDTMDTLPYWYSMAVRGFAGVEAEQFLDVAERWIVDEWKVSGEIWRWDQEPRRNRLERHRGSYSHDHGSMPMLERYHTHLEWHAMWCGIGELLRTHPLKKIGKDDWEDSFEKWVGNEGLTVPPFWLADLRGGKPRAPKLWFAPATELENWLRQVEPDDFVGEICIERHGELSIASSWETQGQKFREVCFVRSALVSPANASFLVRALQTVDDPWDYKLPSEGESLEIEDVKYQLRGWLDDDSLESRLDEKDPFRNHTSSPRSTLSKRTLKSLNLVKKIDSFAVWSKPGGNNAVVSYEAWDDIYNSSERSSSYYDGEVDSDGWRLRIKVDVLQKYLKKIKRDLIFEVEITRKVKGNGYERNDEEEEKNSETFDRVLLFRRDGTIEGAEGRVGTWASSR